jgi:hypothetical protein
LTGIIDPGYRIETKRESGRRFAFESNDPRAVKNPMRDRRRLVAVSGGGPIDVTGISGEQRLGDGEDCDEVGGDDLPFGGDVCAIGDLQRAAAGFRLELVLATGRRCDCAVGIGAMFAAAAVSRLSGARMSGLAASAVGFGERTA